MSKSLLQRAWYAAQPAPYRLPNIHTSTAYSEPVETAEAPATKLGKRAR